MQTATIAQLPESVPNDTKIPLTAKQQSVAIIKSNTSANSKHPSSHSTIVYWDHDNTPMPHGCSVEHMINTVKKHICDTIGPQSIHFRVYTSRHVLHPQPQEALFMNGIEHIHIPTDGSSKCTLRISTDIVLKLFELEQNKESKCIALISNGNDYAYLLSQIHKQPPVSHLLYVTFDQINQRLINSVDFVIQCGQKINTITHSNSTNSSVRNTIDINIRKRQRETVPEDAIPPPKRRRVRHILNLISISFKQLGAPSTENKPAITLQFFTSAKIKQMRIHLQQVLLKSNELVPFMKQRTGGRKPIKMKNPKPVLQYKGKRLQNKRMISRYKINDGDVIYWYATVQIGICHTASPQDIVKFTINGNADIASVVARFKQNIHLSDLQCKMNPDPSKQETHMVLFYHGNRLDQHTSLLQCGIGTHDTLQWDYDRKQSQKQSHCQNMNSIFQLQSMPDLEQGSDMSFSDSDES
eukprot:162611_1